jgi:hypothetical protein
VAAKAEFSENNGFLEIEEGIHLVREGDGEKGKGRMMVHVEYAKNQFRFMPTNEELDLVGVSQNTSFLSIELRIVLQAER